MELWKRIFHAFLIIAGCVVSAVLFLAESCERVAG